MKVVQVFVLCCISYSCVYQGNVNLEIELDAVNSIGSHIEVYFIVTVQVQHLIVIVLTIN